MIGIEWLPYLNHLETLEWRDIIKAKGAEKVGGVNTLGKWLVHKEAARHKEINLSEGLFLP